MSAAATATSPAEVKNVYAAEGAKKVREGNGLFAYENKTKNNVGFSMVPTGLRDAEGNPQYFRASSATLNAPSTATELGRDPDMRRHIPTAPLLAPQPTVRERTLGRRREICEKNKERILYIHTRFPFEM